MTNKRELRKGDIVQINPQQGRRFAGCLMVVFKPKPWGAQLFLATPGERGMRPTRTYHSADFADMEYIGRAVFIPEDLE
jgi:hypothetical protein